MKHFQEDLCCLSDLLGLANSYDVEFLSVFFFGTLHNILFDVMLYKISLCVFVSGFWPFPLECYACDFFLSATIILFQRISFIFYLGFGLCIAIKIDASHKEMFLHKVAVNLVIYRLQTFPLFSPPFLMILPPSFGGIGLHLRRRLVAQPSSTVS